MADCQLVKSLSWSSLPFALAFLFISISTKCFLLYDKAKLRPIFTLLGEQLLESKLDRSCHNAISLCNTVAYYQLQQSLLCQWKGTTGNSKSKHKKWSIYVSGTMENMSRYVFTFHRFFFQKTICYIKEFSIWVSTYLYYQMCYSWSFSLNSPRASVLSVIHFIIMENPPGIWVYNITSKLCTSDCCCHYDYAKNPIISDASDVCCNRKAQRNTALNTTSNSECGCYNLCFSDCSLYQKLNDQLHVDSAPPKYCHHYENKIERLSLVQRCELRPSNKPPRICLAGLLKSGAVYIDWSWCPWGSQAV